MSNSSYFFPMVRPMGLRLQRAELREQSERNLAQHRVNLAAAEAAGDIEGIRIADNGIHRCVAMLNLLRDK